MTNMFADTSWLQAWLGLKERHIQFGWYQFLAAPTIPSLDRQVYILYNEPSLSLGP